MKIALFSEVFTQINGLSVHVKNLGTHLAKNHDVTLYTGSGKLKGCKVVNLPHVPFPLVRGYEVILPKKIRTDADIVHVHTPYSLGLMALRQRKPVIATTHTTPKNLFSAFNLNCLDPLGWKYLISFYNSADHIICQTKATERMFRKHGLKKPVSIVSAGVDFDFFNKIKPGNIKEKYDLEKEYVFSTSRLSNEKRPEMILKACRELNIPLVMISTGPLKEELEEKYPEAKFLGYVSDEDKRKLYSAATIFAIASEPGAEAEGLVVHEARAAKTPVIASKIPPITEFVHDSEDGYLFKSYTEFKKKLKRLWEDKKLRNKFSKQGIKDAKDKDIKNSVKKIEYVYEAFI